MRKAWLLDDNIFISGYIDKGVFTPKNKCCGFSSQIIYTKDIGKIIFYDKKQVEAFGLEIR